METVGKEMLIALIERSFESKMNEECGELIIAHDLWGEALDLAFHGDAKVAFRVSWAMEWAYFTKPDLFQPHTEHFIANYLTITNPSAHRHYTKILSDLLRRKAVALDQEQAESIAEKTLDLLICADTRVAVKVWAMEVLMHISARVDWLKECLREVVERQLEVEGESPAFVSRARKVLKML